MKKTAIAMIFMALTSLAGANALAGEQEQTSVDSITINNDDFMTDNTLTAESLTGTYNYSNGSISFETCPFQDYEEAADKGYHMISLSQTSISQRDPATGDNVGKPQIIRNSCEIVPFSMRPVAK